MSSTSSTNEVNTAYGVSTANTQASTASTQVSTANLSDDTVYVFLASQPNGSQLVHEDLEQIHEDDLEKMDLKWQLALLSMRTIKIIFTPTIDFSNSGLEEFQQPDFEGYGPKISKSVSEDISNEVMKSPDAPLVEELSVDIKNIVPTECLTCLVAKATLDESMLWHKRLDQLECSSKDSGLDNQERPANNTQDDNDSEPSINTANTNVNTGSLNINTINPKVTTAPIKATYDDLSGSKTFPDEVYKVVKALYGLHQAPRAWYETLAKYLLDNGFHRGKIDQTLFIKKQKGDIMLV
ncbi:putative ribonuclease H-like domain-containing protein [Tanacetum coccineum]|uniref:Ribonuclease H-like domain-containing protein n=1 Tax=Tanacetum coccineum TaxID=301880 RepID=A0ABQ5GUT0_9ASTR